MCGSHTENTTDRRLESDQPHGRKHSSLQLSGKMDKPISSNRSLCSLEVHVRASKMAHQGKVIAVKSDNLSLIIGTHMVEGEN